MKKVRSYSEDWDEYVENFSKYSQRDPTNKGRKDLEYPGDEWGKPEQWEALTNKFLKPFLPRENGVIVEIGPGSGKYTLKLVDKAKKIVCFDVSKKFVQIARQRLAPYVKEGRVEFEMLGLWNCNEIVQVLEKKNLAGEVDLFFSIDSMVHVELHTLAAYFINAAKSLRTGGYLVMGVASCTNERGFDRLLEETPWCYGGMRPSHQFYFLSRDIVYTLMEKMGFEIVEYEEIRDIYFTAKKVKEVAVGLEEVGKK